MSSLESYVALALVPGVGRARLTALLAAFETADAVLGASIEALRSVPGINLACATAITHAKPQDSERILREVAIQGAVALLPGDARFPRYLKDIPDAPTLLFARGKLEL